MSAITDITKQALQNSFYRRVIYTGDRSQLVVMAISPSEEIGQETHRVVEQTLFIVEGEGVMTLDGQQTRVRSGDAIVISPGTVHNLTNVGASPLRLYTIYAPPNHIDGRIHRTRAEADQDTADEQFGRQQR